MSESAHGLTAPAPHCEPFLTVSREPDHGVRNLRAPRRTPHDGRSTALETAPETAPEAPFDLPTAHRFAEHALRLVMEVLDRRRPIDHLVNLIDSRSIEPIRLLSQRGGPGASFGPARVKTIRIQPLTPGRGEWFATYTRGPRTLVAVGRIAHASERWSIEQIAFV